jgi:uncharacterized repeat protein (TIGR03943 family)
VSGEHRFSGSRVATGLVLGAWAGAFWFLLLTGRTSLYLSPRTAWLVPVGAALLTIASVGRLTSARAERPEPLRRREAWVLGLVSFPVVAILVLPPTALGAYSAGRRAGFAAVGASSSAADIASGDLTLVDVAAAQTSQAGLEALVGRAGERVEFVGFVVRNPNTPADELLLTRYVVTCCVADATVAQVRVVDVPAGRFEEDQWVRVTGAIYPIGREIIVDADEVVAVSRPSRPYLTP